MNNYFYSNTTKCSTDWVSNITEKEREDRYIVSKALPNMLNPNCKEITFEQTPIKCRVDAKCSCVFNGLLYKFNIEIKNYTHTHTSTNGKPDCVHIKRNKLYGMYNESLDCCGVFLVAIYNHNTYWFNCKRIDWNDVEGEWKYQKITQFDPNSEWASYYTYSLPLSMAYKVVPCGEYEEEWKNGGTYNY